MSTHGCFAILFPIPIDDTPDADGAQEPDATVDCCFQKIPEDFFFFFVEPVAQE